MADPRRLLITCLTHGLALTAGWLAWKHWLAPATADAALSQPSSKTGSPAKPGEISTDEILASLVASPAKQAVWQKAADEENKEFERLIATIEIPEDFPAALAKEISEWLKDDQAHRKPSPMIMALLYHWAIRDAAAMMKWGETDAATQEALMWHSSQVFNKAVKDKGPAILAGALSKPHGMFAAYAMAANLGQGGDASQVLALKASLTEEQWPQVRRWFQEVWPFQQKDSLAKIAITEQQPEMLLNYAKKNGADGMKWLRGLMADESLDPAFKEQVTGSAAWKDYVRNDSTMPLDQRMKLLAGDGKDPSPELYAEIATKDLSAILKSGRDWRNEFRHGEADAAEVLAAMSKELPELAGKAPDALRNRVFLELAEEDPERAMTLLDGLPEAEKAKIAMDAAGRAFGNIDPNQFLAMLGKIPADTLDLWDARLSAWTRKSTRDHARLAEDYITWVRDLPPGLDREMALFSLAKTVQAKNATLASELRGEITNEALKARMEANP